MTPAEILRLAEPFLSMRDTQAPMIRGADDLVAFARAVLREGQSEQERAGRFKLTQLSSDMQEYIRSIQDA